ncbi:hypothetical protein HX792_06930 [Pseudomonas sp. B6002]|uniref:hypothetical protein n=1 Tax=Pseudomonas sp. B6002 TaxID=2726978 RepID=UPI0015A050D3|nr:hypothetical protein [Pseudomonas sp. B6002]NVZ50062.1 hypothetical protein [Pseudomonas sp. B6002]
MDATKAFNLFHLAFRAASDPDTTKGDLRELSLSSDEVVRGAVVMNKSTPSDVISRMRKDESFHVQECILAREAL